MDTAHFKQTLEAEKKLLEQELGELGFKNTTTGEWEATGNTLDVTTPMADANEAADQLEEYEERREETDALQARYSEILHALEKIERGTFGVCEEGNHPIEPERLSANPAARTCTQHM